MLNAWVDDLGCIIGNIRSVKLWQNVIVINIYVIGRIFLTVNVFICVHVSVPWSHVSVVLSHVSLQVDPSGEVMLLPKSCPWKDHLFSVEDEQDIQPTIKFVLFTDQGGKWRVQCVPTELFSFDNRYVLSLLGVCSTQ